MCNRQFNNVGNPGDVHKHAALVNLAKLLKPSNLPLVYIDTHAFLLEAPCAKPGIWLTEIGTLLVATKEYSEYCDMERQRVCSCNYLCSTGLVLDVFQNTPLSLVLGETDPPTREILQRQLHTLNLNPWPLVLSDAHDLKNKAAVPNEAFDLLVLVDPFKLADICWPDIRDGIALYSNAAKSAIVEVFTFDKNKDVVDWPDAPGGTTGPVAVLHKRPYHLAVYCSDNIKTQVQNTCVQLGWRQS